MWREAPKQAATQAQLQRSHHPPLTAAQITARKSPPPPLNESASGHRWKRAQLPDGVAPPLTHARARRKLTMKSAEKWRIQSKKKHKIDGRFSAAFRHDQLGVLGHHQVAVEPVSFLRPPFEFSSPFCKPFQLCDATVSSSNSLRPPPPRLFDFLHFLCTCHGSHHVLLRDSGRARMRACVRRSDAAAV